MTQPYRYVVFLGMNTMYVFVFHCFNAFFLCLFYYVFLSLLLSFLQNIGKKALYYLLDVGLLSNFDPDFKSVTYEVMVS